MTISKNVSKFLKTQGFVDHPSEKEKMIFYFGDRGGIIVFSYDKNRYEMILGYLASQEAEPEFLFSGMSESVLIEKFNTLKAFLYSMYVKLQMENF